MVAHSGAGAGDCPVIVMVSERDIMFDKLSLSQDWQLTEEEDSQHTELSDAGLSQNPPLALTLGSGLSLY